MRFSRNAKTENPEPLTREFLAFPPPIILSNAHSHQMVESKIPTKYPRSGYPSTNFDAAHPAWNPHVFQGWATDFVPKLVSIARREGAFDENQIELVSGRNGIAAARQLAREEGIFCGISGGGIVAAALRFAETAEPGTNILAMITDTGERYLSTDLFKDVQKDGMTPEEQALSDSTPSRKPPRPKGMHGLFPSNTDDLFEL